MSEMDNAWAPEGETYDEEIEVLVDVLRGQDGAALSVLTEWTPSALTDMETACRNVLGLIRMEREDRHTRGAQGNEE